MEYETLYKIILLILLIAVAMYVGFSFLLPNGDKILSTIQHASDIFK